MYVAACCVAAVVLWRGDVCNDFDIGLMVMANHLGRRSRQFVGEIERLEGAGRAGRLG